MRQKKARSRFAWRTLPWSAQKQGHVGVCAAPIDLHVAVSDQVKGSLLHAALQCRATGYLAISLGAAQNISPATLTTGQFHPHMQEIVTATNNSCSLSLAICISLSLHQLSRSCMWSLILSLNTEITSKNWWCHTLASPLTSRSPHPRLGSLSGIWFHDCVEEAALRRPWLHGAKCEDRIRRWGIDAYL